MSLMMLRSWKHLEASRPLWSHWNETARTFRRILGRHNFFLNIFQGFLKISYNIYNCIYHLYFICYKGRFALILEKLKRDNSELFFLYKMINNQETNLLLGSQVNYKHQLILHPRYEVNGGDLNIGSCQILNLSKSKVKITLSAA